uniref:T9SS type A sorting domain-containing protein n=1 Tax=uncultured Draconibacterium sp. TaxID=1573823 RepID=UPI00321782C3
MKKNYKKLRTTLTVQKLLFLGLFVLAANAGFAQATLSTDKLDYAPGETVYIEGTGWHPGETVNLMVMNLTYPELNSLPHYLDWNVTADSNGSFSSWWDVTEDELNTELVLTALGQSSGYKEQVFFTDGNHTGFSSAVISGAPVTICNGTSVPLSLNVNTCTEHAGSGNTDYTANYLWQESPDNSTWGPATGSNESDTYSASPSTNTYYRCIITITGEYQGCGLNVGESFTTEPVLISVGESPGIFDVSVVGSSCSLDEPLSVVLSDSETGVEYTLYRNNDNQIEDGPVPGTGGSISFAVDNTTPKTYYVLAENTTSHCTNIMNGVVQTSPVTPEIFDVTGSGEFCPPAAGLEVGLTDSESGLIYELYKNGFPEGTSIVSIGGPLNFGVQQEGIYTVYAHAPNGCVQMMNESAVIIEGKVEITTCPPTKTIEGCSTADLTGPAYNESETTSSLEDFEANGGVAETCGNITVTYQDVSSGNCPVVVTRTWKIESDGGPSDNCDQIIKIDDTTPPDLTGDAYEQDGTVEACFMPTQLEAEAAFSSANALEGYSDVCSGTNLTAVLTGTLVEGNNCDWTITYTYTIKDQCQNELTGQQYTTEGGDNTPPALTDDAYEQEGTVEACIMPTQEEAEAAFSSANALEGYSDVCSGTNLTAVLTGTLVEGNNCDWTITYTYSVVDQCTNSFEGQHYTTVGGDNTPPALTDGAYEQEGTVEACIMPTQEEAETAFSSANALEGYSDVCSGTNLTAVLTGTLVEGNNCDWTITYTYSVVDQCDNAYEGQHYTTVGGDNTPPALTDDAYEQEGTVETCIMPTQEEAETAFSSENALEGYSDVCSGTNLTAVLTGTVVEGDNCDWTITYTYSVVDQCTNAFEGQHYTTVGGDNTPPALTGDPYVQDGSVDACKPTLSEAELAFSSANALVGYSDVCSGTNLTAALTGTLVDGDDCDWTITYTYTVKDQCQNELTEQHYTSEGGDNTPPTAVCRNITVKLDEYGQATIAEDAINNGSSDNCTAAVDLIFDTDITEFNCDNIGENPVVLTVTDVCGKYSTCDAVVTVIVPTTTVAKISAESARYMDNITFYAEIESYCGTNDFTGEVEFFLDGSSVGTAMAYPIPYDEEGYPTKLRATLIHKITEMPGDYELTATFTPSTAFYAGSASNATPFEVVAREASAYNSVSGFYTGTVLAWTTGPSSSTGTVTLATVLFDANTPTGDLRGAKVTFWMEDANGNMKVIPSAKDLPVGLVEMTDGSVGIASADVQFDIGKSQQERYPVWVEVTGGYTNNFNINNAADAYVTVAKPVPGGSIAGSGLMTNEDSNGQIKGATDYKTSFAFDVTYNKKKTNPQGKMVIWIQSWYKSDGTLDDHIHYYKITSNAINLLVMGSGETYNSEEEGYELTLSNGQAIFDAKANLAEKIDGVYSGIEGNSPLHVTMTDPDNGASDGEDETIGITYFNSAGGIWFSSNYSLDGNEITEEQALDPGADNYIEVKTDASVDAASTKITGKTKSAEIEIAIEPFMVESAELKVYPNPFNEQARFEFVSPVATQAKIDIYNMAGQMVKTIFDGYVEENTTYHAGFSPETQVSGLYFYKMQLGDQVYNGKLVYKKE